MNSFRVPTMRYLREARFREFLAALKPYAKAADELAFFTASTHSAIPAETVEARMRILRERMVPAREAGFGVGVNVLATIGHSDEYLADALRGDYTPFTGMDGREAKGSFCPNDPRFRAYVRRIYTAVAEAGPDFVWIDDDVRMAWHDPLPFGCFCPTCLRIFNEANRRSFDREGLGAALGADRELRRRMLRHNADTVVRLLELVRDTVHAVDPRINLGLMTTEQFYDGYDFGRFAEVLSTPASGPVRLRPGGGFYDDDCPAGVLKKAHGIGRQVAALPPAVTDIQAEIENFPYQMLKKCPKTIVLESAAYIAAGASGAAFNVLPLSDESIPEFEPLLRRLAGARPFFERLGGLFGRTPPQGVWAAWKKDQLVTETEWPDLDFTRELGVRQRELFEIGLPCAYSPENASVTLLSAGAAAAFDDDELARLLARGVYLDGPAAAELAGRGMENGFRIGEPRRLHATEQMTDDPLNAGLAGKRRDCLSEILFHPLEPAAPGARILGRLGNRMKPEPGENSLGIFEGPTGGRLAVAGYLAWEYLQTHAKTVQLKRLFRYLSRDTLPGYVESYHKANLWVRAVDGGLAAALVNAAHEPAEDLALLLLTSRPEATVTDDAMRKTVVQATGRDAPYTRFRLPPIPPWSMVLVQA